MTRVFALALLVLALSISSFAQSASPTLFQKPTVNRTHIVFGYAGDLWIVPREGGDAKRLTVGVGTETDPHFSPDGSMIAFTGQYDGNMDVYVVPTAGGVPRGLTYHPGPHPPLGRTPGRQPGPFGAGRHPRGLPSPRDPAGAVGWPRDGKRVLFGSSRNSTSNYARLFTVALDGGGLPAEMPLPVASFGSFSGDGSAIAYEPLSQWQP